MSGDFVCPHCGADLPAKSKFCPECGSDDQTGWSEETYLDGVSLPGEWEDAPVEGNSKGTLDRSRGLWIVVAAILLGVALLSFFR